MSRNLAPNRLASAITGELRNHVLRGLIQDQERLTQSAIDAHNAKVMEVVGTPSLDEDLILQVRAEAEAIRLDNMMSDMFDQKIKQNEGKTADQLADEQEKGL